MFASGTTLDTSPAPLKPSQNKPSKSFSLLWFGPWLPKASAMLEVIVNTRTSSSQDILISERIW